MLLKNYGAWLGSGTLDSSSLAHFGWQVQLYRLAHKTFGVGGLAELREISGTAAACVSYTFEQFDTECRSLMERARGAEIAIRILRISLALAFLVIGTAKLTSSLQTVQLFAAIGWGQWFRYLTGLLDVIGALLLFVPRWTAYGALVLVCTIGLATLLNVLLLHHNPAVPVLLTVLAAALAWLAWPRRAI